jgi:hypothetical protein
MPVWRHNICETCWEKFTDQHSRLKHPFRLKDVLRGVICCFCGKRNRDGIYVRADGRILPCKGQCPH